MTAKQAAWKINGLGGTPTQLALERYGVPEQEARDYMRWFNSKRARGFKGFLRKKNRRRRPVLMFGLNTVKR